MTFMTKAAGPLPNGNVWPSTWAPTLMRKTDHPAAWNVNSPMSLLPLAGPTPGVVER